MEQFHGTTIVSARRGARVALGGDGQVTLGNIVVKASARKVRRLFADKILAAYPGGETVAGKWTARNLMRDSSFGWNAWTWARLQTKTGKAKVFVYYFDEKAEIPAGPDSASYGARHASELPYVFRQLTEHGRPAPSSAPKFDTAIDVSGFPIDPMHPFNLYESKQR